MSYVFDLIKYRDFDEVKKYFDENPKEIKEKDDEKNNLLYYAVKSNNEKVVKYLIDKKVKPDMLNKDGVPPYFNISENTSCEVIEHFINAGIDINQIYNERQPLGKYDSARDRKFKERNLVIKAIIKQNIPLIELLIKKGIDFDLTLKEDNPWNKGYVDSYHISYYPLHYGTEEIADLFLKNNFKFVFEEKSAKSLLNFAISNDKLSFLKKIIELFNIDINKFWVNSWDRDTLLSYSAYYNRFEFVKYLVELKADVNLMHKESMAPIHYAAKSGNAEMIKYLINNGADKNIKDSYHKNFITVAIYENHSEIIKEFDMDFTFEERFDYHKNGPDFNFEGSGGSMGLDFNNYISTVIMNKEPEEKKVEIIKFLTEKGSKFDNSHIIEAIFYDKFYTLCYMIETNYDFDLLLRNEKGTQSILDALILRYYNNERYTNEFDKMFKTIIKNNHLVLQYLKLNYYEIYLKYNTDLNNSKHQFKLNTGKRIITLIPKSVSKFVYESNNETFDDLPKINKDENIEVYKRINNFIKDVKRVFKERVGDYKKEIQTKLFDNSFYSIEQFNEIFINDPIMNEVASSVIWGVYEDEKLKEIFKFSEDGSFQDIYYNTITLNGSKKIKPVHPLELSKEQIEKIQELLKDFEIAQVIPQINIETYLPQNKDTNILTQFENKIMKPTTFRSRMYSNEWNYGDVKEHGIFYDYSKVFNYFKDNKSENVKVTINYSGDHIRANQSNIKEITTGKIIFSKNFSELPSIVYSEIIRHLNKII